MSHLKKILVPFDFSTHSQHAFEIACSLARDYAGRLVLLHVVPPPIVVGEVGMPVYSVDEDKEVATRKLHQVKCSGAAVPLDYHVKIGDPAIEILELAREGHCDLIVMGTHGRSGFRRVIAGSVAEEVLRSAPCPVLTVRGDATMPAVSSKEKKVAAGV